MLSLSGNADGSGAIDYTVNCASGFPIATGRHAEPGNHVLPAWDVADVQVNDTVRPQWAMTFTALSAATSALRMAAT